jgi:hypothetical protein
MVAGMGTFTANVSGASKVVLAGQGNTAPTPGVTPLGPPFDKCQQTGPRVDCELSRMPAGDSGVLSLYVQREFSNTDFEESTTDIRWLTRSSGTDPKFDNNDRAVRIVWCGDKATSPGCASAQ